MHFTTTELLTYIEAWLWPFFRVAGLIMVAPITGTRTVPARIRLVLVLVITLVIAPVIPDVPYIDPLSATGLLVTVQQVVIGIAMGLALRFVFVVLEMAGEVIAQQMGLGFALQVDPQNGHQVPLVSQFYIILATLIYLSLNGHLILVQTVVESFNTLPIGIGMIHGETAMNMVLWGGWLLSKSILIALPAITAMMTVNLSFGVMTKTAPQLNIFAVGFPFMILIGMTVILLTLRGLEQHLTTLFGQAFEQARQMLAGG